MTEEALNLTNDTKSLYTSRVIVIQTIYSFDILYNKKTIEQILYDCTNNYLYKHTSKSLNIDFCKKLTGYIICNISNIDHKIHINLEKNWKMTRLPKLVLSILRSGIGESLSLRSTNIAVTISDYLEITKSFNHIKELGFINSILENYRATI